MLHHLSMGTKQNSCLLYSCYGNNRSMTSLTKIMANNVCQASLELQVRCYLKFIQWERVIFSDLYTCNSIKSENSKSQPRSCTVLVAEL